MRPIDGHAGRSVSLQAETTTPPPQGWRDSIRPYLERAPLAALLLGISSGFPFAMIGATLTTRLAQDGFQKSSITAFSLAFLVYNFKPLWAWVVDAVRLPVIGRLGQRVSWLLLAAALVMLAVANLAMVDPQNVGRSPVGQLMLWFGLGQEGSFAALFEMAVGAVLVGFAGATFDVVIDAYRIEILRPEQLGVGSGMSQYGWRLGSAGAGAPLRVLAGRQGGGIAHLPFAMLPLPAVTAAFWVGEPERHREAVTREGRPGIVAGIVGPFTEFFSRHGAWLVLLFILLHKIGDTLGQLTLRLLLDDLGFTNDEIAIYDVGIGFWAYLIGIFIGGILYARIGMKRSVLLSLILMAVSNFSFAVLAAAGHSNWGLAGAIGFENIASGIGGVVGTSGEVPSRPAWQVSWFPTADALTEACARARGRAPEGARRLQIVVRLPSAGAGRAPREIASVAFDPCPADPGSAHPTVAPSQSR